VRLLVVVPFLNEEEHLGDVLASLEGQTRPADEILLVDDGSIDGSAGIAESWAQGRPEARLLRRPPRAPDRDRLAAAGELRAFQWALERAGAEWDVAAKLDSDVRLTPLTVATLEERFRADERLGLAGSFLTERGRDGHPGRLRIRPEHVHGATKFYRRACWEDIAPLPAILGWDTIDEVRARMHGWRTASFEMPDGDPVHLRPRGSHDGALRAWRRFGECAWGVGEPAWHVAAYGLRELRSPPRVAGGLSYVLGWALSPVRRRPRADPATRAFLRAELRQRARGRMRVGAGRA
jgi:biofilm PGA synthesis N-glycosyltransferase PgaC